jgi:hypothetical protein
MLFRLFRQMNVLPFAIKKRLSEVNERRSGSAADGPREKLTAAVLKLPAASCRESSILRILSFRLAAEKLTECPCEERF